MKVRLIVISVLALAALAVVPGAQAQGRDIFPFVFTVPFDFTVNNVTLPAGKYTIEENKLTADAWDFVIIDEKGAHKAIFGTESAARYKDAPSYMLTFDEIGDKHFLAFMWLADSRDGYSVPKGAEERDLIKAGKAPAASNVPITKK